MTIDGPRWVEIQEIFHEALERAEPERRAYLEARCAGDASLLAHVLALIEADARGGSLLERGVAEVARDVLEDSLPMVRAVGPYRLERVLGQGGMGVVYLARRADLGSVAAIKVLRDAWVSPARRERFASEQRTLAQLSHASIARLFDADTLPDGTPYFVMEYVEGEPLTAYCAARDCGLEQRLELFRRVCEAVLYAHRHAVIHRDLKPSNILVTADGSVKLLDFGIAKQLEAVEAPAEQTRTELRMMTPAYAAPEQVRGEPVGTYTDIYALGVILYELLAGRLPFDLSRRTPGQVEALLLGQEPERPSLAARRPAAGGGDGRPRPVTASAAAWSDLDVLCLTAMHKDPQRRYRTVDALTRDLERYLRGEPLEARPDTLRYRAGKFLRRNRRAVAATGLVTAAMVAVVAYYTIRLASARDAAVAEAARAQRIQQFTLRLFEGGEEQVGPADTLHVLTLVDRGVQEARVLDAEPAIQAELYATLGGIYQKLGNLDRADSLLRAALEQRRAVLGARHADVAATNVSLGLLRADQSRYEEAEALVREAIAASRANGDPHAEARALTALGRVLQERGAYADAIAVLNEAVRLQAAEPPTSADLLETLNQLANTYYYAGELARSDSLNRVILERDRELWGDRHPIVADDLINLGVIQFDRGFYVEAEPYLRQALDIFLAYHGPEHPQTASNMTILARALIFQTGRDDEARQLLERSLATRERLFGPVHPGVASTLNELGSLALRRKDYDAAEANFARMADIYRATRGEDHYLVAIALSNLASVQLNRERYDAAEPMFRDVIARLTRALSAEHMNTGIAHLKLGRALTGLSRFEEAERQLTTGYAILMKQTSPSVPWLQTARTDLIKVYEALGQPENAERYRNELARAEAGAAAARPGS